MKAEETGDEDTLIQIVEDMLMRDEETGDDIDEVEDALMKAEDTGDEDAVIQIVEDMLMKDDEESI